MRGQKGAFKPSEAIHSDITIFSLLSSRPTVPKVLFHGGEL